MAAISAEFMRIFIFMMSALLLSLILIPYAMKKFTTPPDESYEAKAGPSEQSFGERFGLTISLPMKENEFLEIVEQLDLRFYKRGPGELLQIPENSTVTESIDLAHISHAYWISDPQQYEGYSAIYAAFVNFEGYVVSIKSHFAFDDFGF